jgi:CheY-like chemotaxis protein
MRSWDSASPGFTGNKTLSGPYPLGMRSSAVYRSLVALALAGCSLAFGQTVPPVAAAGNLDLRSWDFRRDGIVPLDGQWRFHWGRFEDPNGTAEDGHLIRVPGAWNDVPVGAATAGAQGHATYAITVECNDADTLALNLPLEHSAARWYVNGAEVARQGNPGVSAETARPSMSEQMVRLPSLACPMRVVAHVSNFALLRGGLMRSVELGDEQVMERRRTRNSVRDIGTIAVLGCLGAIAAFVSWRRRSLAALYLSILAVCLGLSIGVTGTRVLLPLVPFEWDGYLRFIFFVWTLTTAAYALCMRELLPSDLHPRVVAAFTAWSALAAGVILLSPSSFAAYMVPAVAAVSGVFAGYVVWALARKAWHRERRAAALLIALIAYAAAAVYDIAELAHLHSTSFAAVGTLVLAGTLAWALARTLHLTPFALVTGHPAARRISALLVDDDEAQLLLMRKLLPHTDFDVQTASNGQEAIEAVERSRPDVVLMDLDMPVMGGMVAAVELRALEQRMQLRPCPLIAVTSHSDENTRRAAVASGFDRFISKPATRKKLAEALGSLGLAGSSQLTAMPAGISDGGDQNATDVAVDAAMEDLIPEFIESRRKLLLAMLHANESGEGDEVRRIAHQLAGSFALYGFEWASAQARRIEKGADALDSVEIAECASSLLYHLKNVRIRFTTESPSIFSAPT